jgi:DNA-directed RNA polymerase subunit RPC12/RpoP
MALHEYECPACGGAMEFNPKTQKIKCPFCDSEFDVKDYVANHNSNSAGESADNYVTGSSSASEENSQPMYIYSCGSCGGEILATESLGSMKCPFCSNNVVVNEKFTGKFTPDYIIPFTKTKEDAMAGYKTYVKSKKLLPKVFLDQNHIDEIKGIYVPFWLYDATQHYTGSFNATKVRTWSDSKYNYTETSFYDVERSGTERFEKVPVDGSKEMPDDLMESIEPFDQSAMIPFNMGYLAGFLANKYNVSVEENRARALKRMNDSTIVDFRNTISGYATLNPKNENCTSSDESSKYALYPVYVLNTSWKGNNYLFAMNGQTGKFVGNLPFSTSRAATYYFPIAGAVALVAFALFSLFG